MFDMSSPAARRQGVVTARGQRHLCYEEIESKGFEMKTLV